MARPILNTWMLLGAVGLSAVGCSASDIVSDEAFELTRYDSDVSSDVSDPSAQLAGPSADTSCSAPLGAAPTAVAASSVSSLRNMPAPKGPYPVVMESDPGLSTHTVYRPATLGTIKHPVVVWGNGGCVKDGTGFAVFLREFASHGFVVIADGKPNGGFGGGGGMMGDATPLTKALDWIIAESKRPCSQYYDKLDTSKTAAMGQSCGGLMALRASKDPRLSTVVVWNSGLFARDQAIYNGLHTPVAYFIGGRSDIAYANAEADVKAITKVPLFYGNLDVGHGGTYFQANGGEFANAGIGWLKWHLMGDEGETGKGLFSGSECALCKPPSKWVVVKKNLD
ncbi:MAG: alpha/beta hydrolase [Polyangiales bacterium]